MFGHGWKPRFQVNRHTGGLENIERVGSGICCVNRHTGGLEIAMWGISIAHYR